MVKLKCRSNLECIGLRVRIERRKPIDNYKGHRSDWAGNQNQKILRIVKTIYVLFRQVVWATEIEDGTLEIPFKTISLWSLCSIMNTLILRPSQALVLISPLCFKTNNEPIFTSLNFNWRFPNLSLFPYRLYNFNTFQVFLVKLFSFD